MMMMMMMMTKTTMDEAKVNDDKTVILNAN